MRRDRPRFSGEAEQTWRRPASASLLALRGRPTRVPDGLVTPATYQKPAPGPPPTNVSQSPQPSLTVNGTVVAWSGVTRSTMKSTAMVLAGAVYFCPLTIDWPLRVTLAFWRLPKVT